MKTKDLLSRMMLLLAVLLAGASTAWAQDVSYTFSSFTSDETVTLKTDNDNLTITLAKGSGSTKPTWNEKSSEARVYAKGSLSVASTSKNIVKIVYSYSINANKNNVTPTIDGVEGSTNKGTWDETNQTWTGSDQTVTMSTSGSAGNIGFTKIEVWYESSGETPDPSEVAKPTFSIAAGAVVAGTTVTLTQDAADMIIYTTDGSDPSYDNNNGDVFTVPIAITKPITIKAIAVDTEGNESAVASSSYTILVSAPTFSIAAGEVKEGSELTITSAEGYTILYTTDGSSPSWENSIGEEYTTPIVINNAMTIKAITVDDYENESVVVSAAYTIKVAGAIEFVPTYSAFGLDSSTSGNAKDEVSVTYEGVTITYTRNNGSLYLSGSAMRFYKENDLKFEVNTDKVIKNIVLTMSSAQTDLTSSPEGYDNNTKTWTGEANTVTISRPSSASSYAQITKITIVVADAIVRNVATPTFSIEAGNYVTAQNVEISCETTGAEIFYTIDGSTPTAESTKYTGAIAVSETTTLKAIAVNDGESSAVATATYTFPTIYANLAAFIEANTTGYLNVDGAQVVYIDDAKKNIYVRDASGAIDLFNSNGFTTSLKTGDLLSGVLYGKYSPYKNLPEIASVDLSNVTVTGNEVVVAKVIEGTTEAIAANLCDLVKIQATEISENNNKYYVGDDNDIQLYDNFSVGYTVTTGKTVDVQGIATVYNTTYELFPRFESDIVYLDNAVAVEIGTAGMATFSSDKALDFTGVDAIYAYTVTVSGTEITFKRIRKLPANTGVLLRNPQGMAAVAAVNVSVIDEKDAETVENNCLVAVSTEIASLATDGEDGAKNYILNKKGDNVGFYLAAGNKVGAGKAYLSVPKGVQARSFIGFSDDETTGIEAVESNVVDFNNVYNMQGMRVNAPTKGLYIVNGKKVIFK